MNIVILGPQGSGKGTQARLLAEALGLFHMENGRLLREIAEKDTRIRNLINSGNLVPDEEMLEYMKKFLTRSVSSFDNIVFDGFPRTIKQYNLLSDWLSKEGFGIDKVVYLDVSDEVSVKRLSARRVCSVCGRIYNLVTDPPTKPDFCECGGRLIQREDDKDEAIRERLEIFRNETLPILDLPEVKEKLIKIDGERPVEVIFNDILERLGQR